MSHFSNLATKITCKATLMESLTELGYQVEEAQQVRGYRGQETPVELAIRMREGYDIGFMRNSQGTYDVVADWFGVKGITEKSFMSQLQQHYAVKTVMNQINQQGYNLVEQQRDANGAIRIVARRWV
jgi:hypothetical protein